MNIAYYHIDDTITTRTFNFKIQVLRIIPTIAKQVFSFKFWKRNTIKYLNKSLSKIFLLSEGLKSVMYEIESKEISYKKSQVEQVYQTSEKILIRYRKLMASLEKINYLENEEMKLICENTLSNFYSFEAFMRQLNFEDSSNINEDNRLSKFTSVLSLG